MAVIGFRPRNPLVYRIYNIVTASLLLVLTSPVFLILTVAVGLTQGRKIFYSGERIGKDRSTFNIYKFRTLCEKRAAALTKDRTLPADADIFTPLGRFLRDTRLDELPQIWNVLRGDMNLCGPRPVRAEIRDIHVRGIPNYDIRFEVRPGLLGPTQAYFGHGSSKRLRARMNNIAVRRPVSYRAEIGITLRIIGAMVSRVYRKVAAKEIFGGQSAQTRSDLSLRTGGDSNLAITEMNREFVRIEGAQFPSEQSTIIIKLRSGAIRRADVSLMEVHASGGFHYKPVNDLSAYTIERYALGKVVVPAAVNRIGVSDYMGIEKVTPSASARV